MIMVWQHKWMGQNLADAFGDKLPAAKEMKRFYEEIIAEKDGEKSAAVEKLTDKIEKLEALLVERGVSKKEIRTLMR